MLPGKKVNVFAVFTVIGLHRRMHFSHVCFTLETVKHDYHCFFLI